MNLTFVVTNMSVFVKRDNSDLSPLNLLREIEEMTVGVNLLTRQSPHCCDIQ